MPRQPIIETLTLGRVPSTYISTISAVKESELIEFVDKLKLGPQIVSIPVPPYRHAFLIHIMKDKVMISDWYGDNRSCDGWEQYTDMLNLVEKKYGKISYYPVDPKIKLISDKHNSKCGGGGCSYYIYEWITNKDLMYGI